MSRLRLRSVERGKRQEEIPELQLSGGPRAIVCKCIKYRPTVLTCIEVGLVILKSKLRTVGWYQRHQFVPSLELIGRFGCHDSERSHSTIAQCNVLDDCTAFFEQYPHASIYDCDVILSSLRLLVTVKILVLETEQHSFICIESQQAHLIRKIMKLLNERQ